jgi:hypothetical protein
MNAIPKAYFSRGQGNDASTTKALEDARRLHPRRASGQESLSIESWEQAPMLTGELTAEIKRLKAKDGNPVIAHGGADFARSLIAMG